eukprot:08076.XXX_67605_82710_1 [CDS] Oithona nana genome sequencing.
MINQSSYGGHHHLHQATSALLNQAGFPNNAAHAAQAGLVRTLLPGGHPSVSLGLEVSADEFFLPPNFCRNETIM